MTPRCPTCGGAVEVVTADEGTSSFRPVDASPARPHLIPDAAVEAMLVARYGYAEEWPGRRASVRVGLAAALPHLLTDEMVERAARALGSHGDDGFAHLEEAARAALEAALESTA